MSNQQSIDWELIKLHPGPYDLFVHLDRWFNKHPTLLSLYHGVPKTGLAHWTRMRERQQKLDKGDASGWRSHAQKRLLALMLGTRLLADRLWEVKYDSWLLRNCRPSGGQWRGSRYESGPTGKSCRNRACPWCWLRMYAFLRQVIVGKGTVAHPSQNYTVPCLGLGPIVSCKMYQSLELLTEESLHKFKSLVDKDFRESSKGCPKPVMRLCTPVFTVEQGWTVRISYIYKSTASVYVQPVEGLTAIFDKVFIQTALTKCYPYPEAFLDDTVGVLSVRNVLNCFLNTRSFTTQG